MGEKNFIPQLYVSINFFTFSPNKPIIMKNVILCFIILCIAACTAPVKEAPDMPGAYLMTTQILNDGKGDTKYTTLKQLKIYTGDFMMYTQVNSADSVSAFGVGSYTADTSGVTEKVIFRARDTLNNPPATYKLNIVKTGDGYEQVIPEITIDSRKYKLRESYQAVGNAAKSPLDGVWKEVYSYTLNGRDTLRNARTQYKAFYAGNFMWGHSLKDSLSRNRTGIGFGTFTMSGDNKMKETDLNSTYQIIAGQSFDVDVEITGADNYKQTISYPDGSKSVEYYERLKL